MKFTSSEAGDLRRSFERANVQWGLEHCTTTLSKNPELETILNQYESEIKARIRILCSDNDNILDAFEMLCKLRAIGINWAWINTWLKANKNMFIKQLLIIVKDNEYMRDIQKILYIAKDANLNWPEFIVIQKSIDSDNLLSENASLNNLNTILLTGKFYKLHYINILNTDIESIEILNKYETEIRRYIRTNLYEHEIFDTFMLLCKLQTWGISWPWINTILSTNKPKFIKHILLLVQDEDFHGVTYALKYAKDANINWPEFDIIQKSINASLNEALESTNAEAHNLLLLFSRGNFQYGLVNCNTTISKNPELAEVFDQYKFHINSYIRAKLFDCEDDEEFAAFIMLCKLREIGITWPWIKKMLIDNKSTFVKRLLVMVKDGEFDDDVQSILNFARFAHINWDEFAIIQRSIKFDSTLNENLSYMDFTEIQRSFRIGYFYHGIVIDCPDLIISKNRKLTELFNSYEKSIEAHIQNLLNDHYEIDALNMLCKLHKINVAWPWINKMLANKSIFIKKLLDLVKRFESVHYINYTIDLAKSANINWPEFDIIQKSINFSLNEDGLDRTSHLRYLFDKGNFYVGLKQYSTSDIKPVLNEYELSIKKELKARIRMQSKILNAFQILCKLRNIEINWSWVDELLENNKSKFIKGLLSKIKTNGDYMQVKYELKDAKEAKLNWPELDIIRKSVEHESSLHENIKAYYKNLEADSVSYAFSQNYFDIGILDCSSTIKKNPKIGKLLTKFENEIKQNIDFKLSKQQGFIAFKMLCKLLGFGITWQWVTEILITNKSTFVKEILWLVKRNMLHVAKPSLDFAKEAKLNWPELDIIQKSINRDLRETVEPNTEWVLTMLKADILRSNIFIGLYHIDSWGLTVTKVPGLEELLDHYKTELVRSMLKNITDREYGQGATEQVLSRLEKAGIKWPELAIIRRSLDIEINKQ